MYWLRRSWAELRDEVFVLPSRTLVFVWVIALLVSFVGNASLVNTVRQASQTLSVVESPGSQVPAVESLRRLDTLRLSLFKLRGYEDQRALRELDAALNEAENRWVRVQRARAAAPSNESG